MNTLPTCVLYTQDEKLEHKIQVNLRLIAKVRSIHSSDKLTRVYRQSDASILLVDLRGDDWGTILPNIRKIWPDLIIIALGVSKSDPMIEAESMDLYATESLGAKRQTIQALVSRALNHQHLLQENQILKEQTSVRPPVPDPATHRSDRDMPTLPLQHFSRAFRHFDDIDLFLKHMAEAVATSARVTRVGIFCLRQEEKTYELRADYRCLDTVDTEAYDKDDFLVQWLQEHGHVIARNTLEFVKDHKERRFLKETLDLFGVEVIMPIQARGELLGWLLIGHRITGVPFEMPDLEDLMVMADHVSATLVNALLYEQVTHQKTLADQLLQSIPTGIVAISEDTTIQMVNPSAEQILNVVSENSVDKAVEVLGSRLAGLVRQTIGGDEIREPKEWFNEALHRHLCVNTRRLVSHGKCIGALVLVQDATDEKILKEKQEGLERAKFWTELAASISHEIHNPLVAIKTLAQLLPERYDDPKFRAKFSQLVDHEVDRLNRIVDQIHKYAHPPKFAMKSVDVGHGTKRTIEDHKGRLNIEPEGKATLVTVAMPVTEKDLR